MSAALLATIALVVFVLAARVARARRLDALLAGADGVLTRTAPAIAAVATIGVVWFAWGAWRPAPRIQDEFSYVLQARIFAGGHWTAPRPPVPDFFAQPHVLVEPSLASKYPPGHALLLAPGAAMGFDALVPLLLAAATAALLVALVARLTNVWVALFAWVTWLSAPMVLRFEPSFFSEVSTTALVLASWWALLRWRETRRTGWLLGLAAAVGWGAITRPLTMLAFAIPIGVVVLRDVARLGAWRALGGAIATGVAVLGLLPLWSAMTTGTWRLSPLESYRRDYLPFDRIGFSVDRTPPRRELSAQMQSLYDAYITEHEQQPAAALPRTAANRGVKLLVDFYRGARLSLLVLAIVALFAGSKPLRFAAASAAIAFIAYLAYAHSATWTLYYLELTPVAATLAAAGAWWTAQRWAAGGTRVAMAAGIILFAAFGAVSVSRSRQGRQLLTAFNRDFASATARLPVKPAIVFVKYAPNRATHIDVVLDTPLLLSDSVWVVHDLGARDTELLRAAPRRAWYVFDESTLMFGESHAAGTLPSATPDRARD